MKSKNLLLVLIITVLLSSCASMKGLYCNKNVHKISYMKTLHVNSKGLKK